MATIMRNSALDDQWIIEMCQRNPIGPVLNDKGGPTGNFTTGPVRLSFLNIFTPTEPKKNAQGQPVSEPKFGAALIFPPPNVCNMQPLYDEMYRLYQTEFSQYWEPTTQQYLNLEPTFRDQAAKSIKYPGFTPGSMTFNSSTKFKPPVVDPRMNPIIDPAKVYPGVWAICSVNSYIYGKNPPQPKKGVSFGLQTLAIIADDTRLGGGAADPRQQFARMNVRPPVVTPAAQFGQPQLGAPQGMPPGAAPIYHGAPPTLAQMPPPGTYPQTGYAQPAPQPTFPQTGYDPETDASQFM